MVQIQGLLSNIRRRVAGMFILIRHLLLHGALGVLRPLELVTLLNRKGMCSGAEKNKTDVLKILKDLNIQLDNLCQVRTGPMEVHVWCQYVSGMDGDGHHLPLAAPTAASLCRSDTVHLFAHRDLFHIE